MQKIGFTEALDSIVATDNRYSREAYVFLRDALDYTIKQQKKRRLLIAFGKWPDGARVRGGRAFSAGGITTPDAAKPADAG
jgi:hypothetical protein